MMHDDLLALFRSALEAVDPYAAIRREVSIEGDSLRAAGAAYDLASFDRVLVVGAGKAAGRMAAGIEAVLGDRISEGLVIVKDGHAAALRIVRQAEASHPIPNDAGVDATKRILGLVRAAGEKTLVLCLLSGGASSLLVAPADGVTLRDKQEATDLLLRAGASISELNVVRKHLSLVKGGLFAKAAFPARIVTLILSDVIGDRLDVIASGPTASDSSTYSDALQVIDKYGLPRAMPGRVTELLARGAAGQEPETVKSGDSCLHRTRNVIIGSITQALAAAYGQAQRFGLLPQIMTAELEGEARNAAGVLARSALRLRDKAKPGERHCLLSGGETTVVVRGTGLGGRNQELALAFALAIEGMGGITLLSAGTDGTDGPTDAAGAIVDGSTAEKARSVGLSPENYLRNNDSYTFFSRLDALTGERHHLKSGPTGTNVMDIQIVLIEGSGGQEPRLASS